MKLKSFFLKRETFSNLKGRKNQKSHRKKYRDNWRSYLKSLDINPEIKITNARKIVDTRNRIIHGYDIVSEDIIWAIATNDLKKLRQEIVILLEE